MGANSSSGLSFPNYKKIAEAHNLNYLRINNNKQVDKNIDMVLKNNKPVICELMIDPNQEQMPRALYRWKSKVMIKTKYEDMYPFLPTKELDRNML